MSAASESTSASESSSDEQCGARVDSSRVPRLRCARSSELDLDLEAARHASRADASGEVRAVCGRKHRSPEACLDAEGELFRAQARGRRRLSSILEVQACWRCKSGRFRGRTGAKRMTEHDARERDPEAQPGASAEPPARSASAPFFRLEGHRGNCTQQPVMQYSTEPQPARVCGSQARTPAGQLGVTEHELGSMGCRRRARTLRTCSDTPGRGCTADRQWGRHWSRARSGSARWSSRAR